MCIFVFCHIYTKHPTLYNDVGIFYKMGCTMKKLLKIVLSLLLVILIAAAGYIVYVLTAYYRVEDNITLSVQGAGESSLTSETTYRIVTYNVGFGAYSADYSFFMDGGIYSRAYSAEAAAENITGAAEAVKALDADIFLFQEVDTAGTRAHNTNQYELITNTLPQGLANAFAQNYDSPYLFYPFSSPIGANKSGIITYSSFPITSSLRRSLPVEDSLMKLVDLDRCYSVSRVPAENGKELIIYNVHLSAYTSDGSIADRQLEMLFEDMASEYSAGNYVIAGGDFNKDLLGDSSEYFGVKLKEDAPWAQSFPENMTPEGFSIIKPLGDTPTPSCRLADSPYTKDSFVLTVDGFIVSDNIFVADSAVYDAGFTYSDHNPVYLDFVLK